MKRILFLSLFVAAGSLTFSSFAEAQTQPAASDAAWEKFISARRLYQIRLCELASARWPEYANFFAAHRDLQLAYIERRNLVFYRLQKSDPSRIVRNHGGEAFLNFSWSQEEEQNFLKTLPGYQGLNGEIRRLQANADKFKKRDELRDRFARLEIDPEYLLLMRDVTRSINEAEQILAKSSPRS